jgi:hypothetical protein
MITGKKLSILAFVVGLLMAAPLALNASSRVIQCLSY